MAKQIGEDTKVTLDLKTLGMVATGIGMVVGMWFALQADIAEAKDYRFLLSQRSRAWSST